MVPWVAAVSWRVACTILSTVMTVGTLIVWYLNFHVSVRHTAPISVKAFMTL